MLDHQNLLLDLIRELDIGLPCQSRQRVYVDQSLGKFRVFVLEFLLDRFVGKKLFGSTGELHLGP